MECWWTPSLREKSLTQSMFHPRCPHQGCRACPYDQPLLEDRVIRKSTKVETKPVWATYSFATPFPRAESDTSLLTTCTLLTSHKSSWQTSSRLTKKTDETSFISSANRDTHMWTNVIRIALKSTLLTTYPTEIIMTCEDKDSDPSQKTELLRLAWPLRTRWC